MGYVSPYRIICHEIFLLNIKINFNFCRVRAIVLTRFFFEKVV